MFRKLASITVALAVAVLVARESYSQIGNWPEDFSVQESEPIAISGRMPKDVNPREVYRSLLDRKVHQMTDEEISAATEALQAELNDRDSKANAELDSVVQSLRRVATEFRGTEAASIAEKMLRASQPHKKFDPNDIPHDFHFVPRAPQTF